MYNNEKQTESVFDFEMQEFDAVPAGQYVAIFKDVQKTHHDQWGDGVMFVFEIANGEHKGQTATRIGKPKASTQNATGKMIMGITGQSYSQGQRVDLRSHVGKPYNVLVEPTQGGKTRIAQVWQYQQPQTAPIQTYQQPQPNVAYSAGQMDDGVIPPF